MSIFIDEQQNINVEANSVGISWTGQAGYTFKDTKGLIYHIDPYLSNICSETIGYHRLYPAPVEASEVIADVILFTHEHKDHLDTESISDIIKNNADLTLAGPPSCTDLLLKLGISKEQLVTIQRGQEKQFGNLLAKAVCAYHTNDSVGYILTFGDITFYVTGDTTYSDDLISVTQKNIDVIFSCINGRLGCMNIHDAARLIGHIQPNYAVPMHYGMFKENTADPDEFTRLTNAFTSLTKGVKLEQGKWYLYNSHQGFVLNNK